MRLKRSPPTLTTYQSQSLGPQKPLPNPPNVVQSLDPNRPEPIRGILKQQGRQLPDLPNTKTPPPPPEKENKSTGSWLNVPDGHVRLKMRSGGNLFHSRIVPVKDPNKLLEAARAQTLKKKLLEKCYWKLAPKLRVKILKRSGANRGRWMYGRVGEVQIRVSKTLGGKNPFLLYNYVKHGQRVVRSVSTRGRVTSKNKRPTYQELSLDPKPKSKKHKKSTKKITPKIPPLSSTPAPVEESNEPDMKEPELSSLREELSKFRPESLRTDKPRPFPASSELAQQYRECFNSGIMALKPLTKSRQMTEEDAIMMLNGVVRQVFKDTYKIHAKEYAKFLEALKIDHSKAGHDDFFAAHLQGHWDSVKYLDVSEKANILVQNWELPSNLLETVRSLLQLAWNCAISTPRLKLGEEDHQKKLFDPELHETTGRNVAAIKGRTIEKHLWPALISGNQRHCLALVSM